MFKPRPGSFLHARLLRDHHLGLPLTAGILALLSCMALGLIAHIGMLQGGQP